MLGARRNVVLQLSAAFLPLVGSSPDQEVARSDVSEGLMATCEANEVDD